MDFTKKTEIEYQEQHFNFSSELILESIKKMLKACTNDGLESAGRLLHKKLYANASHPETIQKALEDFTTSMSAEYPNGAEYGVSAVEEKIRECLNIPSWIVLSEDRHFMKVDNLSEEALDNDIEELKQQLQCIRFLSSECKDELNVADNIIATLESCHEISIHDQIPNLNEP